MHLQIKLPKDNKYMYWESITFFMFYAMTCKNNTSYLIFSACIISLSIDFFSQYFTGDYMKLFTTKKNFSYPQKVKTHKKLFFA